MNQPSPTRRDVLRDGGSLVGAAFLPTIVTRPKARPSTAKGSWSVDDTLRVGFVGAGRRGVHLLARLGYKLDEASAPDKALEGVEVVAVCDTFERNLIAARAGIAAVHSAPTIYRDYRQMLAAEDLDAVIVATPDFTHAPISQAAIEAGMDVYVEKCAANSPDQLRSLEAALQKHDRILQVGYQLRQDEVFRQAAEVVRKGWIGEVRMARFEVHRHGANGQLAHPLLTSERPPRPEEVDWELFLAGVAPEREYEPSRYFEWRKYWDYSNGVCGDNQSHSVDAIEYLLDLGMPGSAVASGGVYTYGDGRETPDVLTGLVEYPDKGVSVTFIEIGSNSYQFPGTYLFGTEGTLLVSWSLNVWPDRFSERYAEAIASGKLNPNKPMIHLTDPAAAKALAGKPSELWLAGRGAKLTTKQNGTFDTTRLHLDDFFSSVRDRTTPAAPLSVARTSTIAAMMCAQSYRTGRRTTPADLGF